MSRQGLKYGLGILLIVFVGYNSVYFKKLDEVKAATSAEAFDPSAFARDFYDNSLLTNSDSAIELGKLVSMLRAEPDNAFKYSNALAVGNVRYFMVKGEGTITSVTDDAVVIRLKGESTAYPVSIATEFVYGNAIRDASGLIKLDDFTNTGDLNSLSESINAIVRTEVLPPFIARAKTGTNMTFIGAIELNQKYLNLTSIEVVPIKLVVRE